ncbi:MAG: bifunctional metallophosphatase/5'-nucleotidase [Ruminococcus sp.]|nr:bifunctional metallophosphatase/5'-nucleotidase [Ruminococcus sp.]
MKKHFFAVLLAASVLFGISVPVQAAEPDDIVILYENDVHCAVDGYAKLAAMKSELSQTAGYVGVVSAGDYVQGSSLGAISQGEYIVNLMNMVGYDAVTLGNHEFDYKLPRLLELSEMMNTKPVCSNFQNVKEQKTVFEPYSIVSYGDTDIAYIGITTPDTLTSSSPVQFRDEKDEYIYTFSGNNLSETVQKSIDAAKSEGADYIVALSHLGTEDVFEQWSAQTLVKNTTGLDAVLDGHSHSVIENMTVDDKNGDKVVISSTGTKFANIGKMTIADGEISTELIETESYEKTDEAVSKYIKEINEEYSKLGERKIGESKVNLTTVDKDGNRIIRNTETNMGDFCADAFRIVTGADIGVMNGGGIRADMSQGDVTFNDILNVFPWNNRVCVIEVTGQQFADLLELSVMLYPEENGGFQHVSGVTFDLNKSVASTVKLDENANFVSVEGERRVSEIKILNKETGKYEPIDLTKTYTLASHNFLLLEQGSGASMLKDAKVVSDSGMLDVELLEAYITNHLGGVIGEEYAQSQNRINITDGKVAEYKVTYMADDKVVAVVTVKHGEDAVAPEIPKKDGYTAKWDNDGKNITADITIKAIYTADSTKGKSSPKTSDNSNVLLYTVVMGISLTGITYGVRKKNNC